MEKSPFEIYKAMCDDDNKGIAMSNTITEMRQVKQGGLVTFGVELSIYNKLINDESIAICLVVDRAEYEKYK